MAVNQTTEGYELPCGRDVETVWARLDDIDAHQRDCPHCQAARESLLVLRSLTDVMVADESVPSPGLTGRIMSAVRAEVRRGDLVELPTGEPGGARISEAAIAALLRFAADQVPGVRARRCRIHAIEEEPGAIEVRMTIAVSYRHFAGALDRVRARIEAAATGRIGVRLARLDLTVDDVYQP
ncbi:MAG TPA: Asp23/Gls24 family envelope stress response protein [Pseudonocardiaceae bacterium]